MYAVIETGGKQYRVEVGTELEVELLDAEPGRRSPSIASCSSPTATRPSIGRPLVADAAVSAEVLRQTGREGHQLQVPPQGAQPRQEGPPPGADGPAHQRHRARRQERRRGRGARPSATRRPSASGSRRPPPRQAAKDAELAAKLAVGAKAATTKAKADEGRRRRPTRKPAPRPTPKAERQDRHQAGGQEADDQAARPRPPSDRGQGRRRRRQGGRAEAAAPRRRTSRPDGTQEGGLQLKNGRDSVGQRLGVKAGDGQLVTGRLDHRPPARA